MKNNLKNATWVGGFPIYYIEARQDLRDKMVSDAVVIVKEGFSAENVHFQNNCFVCENQHVADEFINAVTAEGCEIGNGRVIVGGMATAINILALSSAKG